MFRAINLPILRGTRLYVTACGIMHPRCCRSVVTTGGYWRCSLKELCYSEHYVEDISQQADSGIAGWMECVTVIIMWKVLHSRWTVVLQLEWSVLQLTLCERYFTARGQYYCSLNGVCYSEHYVEDISQQVDSGIAGWMECVTVNIIWNILHSRWTVVLQVEWSVLEWILSGRYFTAGGQCIAGWMECVTVNIIRKILHSRWTV